MRSLTSLLEGLHSWTVCVNKGPLSPLLHFAGIPFVDHHFFSDVRRVSDNCEIENSMSLRAKEIGDLLAEETDRTLLIADQEHSATGRNSSAQFLVEATHAYPDSADSLWGSGSNQPVSP